MGDVNLPDLCRKASLDTHDYQNKCAQWSGRLSSLELLFFFFDKGKKIKFQPYNLTLSAPLVRARTKPMRGGGFPQLPATRWSVVALWFSFSF